MVHIQWVIILLLFAFIDEDLCSHVWVVCYMAESIDEGMAKSAEPCSRRCPTGPRPGHRLGIPITMGQHTPMTYGI